MKKKHLIFKGLSMRQIKKNLERKSLTLNGLHFSAAQTWLFCVTRFSFEGAKLDRCHKLYFFSCSFFIVGIRSM